MDEETKRKLEDILDEYTSILMVEVFSYPYDSFDFTRQRDDCIREIEEVLDDVD